MNEFNNEAPSEELQWDIDRYILGDESPDCEFFKARMAEDHQLAFWVAERVEELQNIARATSRAAASQAIDSESPILPEPPIRELRDQPTPSTSSISRVATISLTFLATTAAVLMAVFWNPGADVNPVQTTSQDSISQVADNWIAFGEATPETFVLEQETESENWPTTTDTTLASEFVSDDQSEDDWMLQAASEFYADLES